MSLEKIKLPDFLLADLYKDCLVEMDTLQAEARPLANPKPTPISEEIVIHDTKTLHYLGDNKSKITILVNQPDVSIISDEDLAFVINILKACNLSLRDIAVINTHNQDVIFLTLKEQLEAKTILLFNIEPSAINLPFSIPYFQLHKYAGCTILTAPLLSILNQSTEDSRLFKSKLWASLKQLFSI